MKVNFYGHSFTRNAGSQYEHTTSFGDTGARSASAISCAFWLMLPFLARIVRNASPRLFWRPWVRPEEDQALLAG